MNDTASDFIYLGDKQLPFDTPNNLKAIYDYENWLTLADRTAGFPFYKFNEFLNAPQKSFVANFVNITIDDVFSPGFNSITNNENIVFVLNTDNKHGMPEQRRVFFEFMLKDIKHPVIIKRDYGEIDLDQFRLYSATDLGGLLIDGFGDGVWLTVKHLTDSDKPQYIINRTSFGILQAARTRISKTEYIACPSCGRTLFDLVEITNKIRERTEHLKGVKIAIMGCIVNGPGEMADADYGYVGSGAGKITLYRGKEVVKKGVNSEKAVDELIELIKEDGNWIEKRN